MATKKPFLKITCSACKRVNYFVKKSKKMGEKKLEMQKFCKFCKKHVMHKEGKKA